MMKRIAFFTLIILSSVSCSRNDNNSNCNNIPNVGVSRGLNLNFPQYSDLNFISNPIFVEDEGYGGLIVTNTGTGFVAFDAADPNHQPNSCSILTISGLEGICGCADANKYSLFTGQPLESPDLRCGLKAYRAELNGDILFISN